MFSYNLNYINIEERYNNFTYDNLTTLNYTDVIIDFDASKINSLIKSDYILFEQKLNGGYNHMGIGLDNKTNQRFVETFFHEKTDKYISNQTIIKIKSYRLFDINNDIIFENNFK